MDVALAAEALDDDGDLLELLLLADDAALGGVLKGHSVSEREVAAEPGADHLSADGALEDLAVEGEDALEAAGVLPGGDHAADGDALVLDEDGHGGAAGAGGVDLGDHVGDVGAVEVHAVVVVVDALRVGGAPEEGILGLGGRHF